jgi:hypothetical protein
MRLNAYVLTAALAASMVAGLAAQAPQQRPSPPGTAKATIDGATITIDYSRPSVKGRKIMGGLVPWGEVWRTGANEATTLTTDKAIEIGGLAVPAGKYTLFTLPGETEWKLIVNKQTGQWGTEYDQKQDLGRIALKKAATAGLVEQFTISLDKVAKGGVLKLAWENTELTAAIAVK